MGGLGQCIYCTKTLLRSRTRNCCLVVVGGVDKMGGVGTLHSSICGVDQLAWGATTLCSKIYGNEWGGGYVMLGVIQA